MNLTNYLKEIQKELRLTTFPTQAVVVNFTIFVILFTAVMAIYLGALDLGFGEAILKAINNLKTSGAAEVVQQVATTTASTTPDAATTSSLLNTVPANILVK